MILFKLLYYKKMYKRTKGNFKIIIKKNKKMKKYLKKIENTTVHSACCLSRFLIPQNMRDKSVLFRPEVPG